MAWIQIIILIYQSTHEWLGILEKKKNSSTADISTMNLNNKALTAPLVASTVYHYQKRRQRPYSFVKHGN